MRNMSNRLKPQAVVAVRVFVYSASLILLISGLAKLLSAFGNARILSELDPVLEMPNRLMLISVGVLELLGSAAAVATRKRMWAPAIPLWFGSMFLLYRGLLAGTNYGGTCPCLGTLTELLGIEPQQAAHLMTLIAIYLTAGGIVATCCWRTTGSSHLESTEASA